MNSPDISAQVDALRNELSTLAEKFSSYADRDSAVLGDAVHRQARAARRALDRKVAALSEQGGEIADAARAQATDLQDALEAYVVENPIKSVLIAAGVGLIFGAMSRR